MKNQKIIEEKTRALLETHCYDGLRTAAQAWLDALGTGGEKDAGAAYVAMLEESLSSIDHVIDLFGSDRGKQLFGEENAAAMLAHAQEVKAAGGRWCDCPACTLDLELLQYKEDILEG